MSDDAAPLIENERLGTCLSGTSAYLGDWPEQERACCCECSPPEFGGNLPDRDCPVHGEQSADCIECGDHRGWTIRPDFTTGEPSQVQCRACHEHACPPLTSPGTSGPEVTE